MKEAFSPRLTQNLPMGAVVAMVALAIPIAGLAQGTISVFAGTGNPPITPGAIGDGGPAKNAFLDGPDSVTAEPSNSILREAAGSAC